jgi:hypothetical protein
MRGDVTTATPNAIPTTVLREKPIITSSIVALAWKVSGRHCRATSARTAEGGGSR